jgi:hypothetical protein
VIEKEQGCVCFINTLKLSGADWPYKVELLGGYVCVCVCVRERERERERETGSKADD